MGRFNEAPTWPADMSLNTFVLEQTYLLKAVTGLGYLALTWSTVVLLGGFIGSLKKKDFLCLTMITMVQATRIIDDLAEHSFMPFFHVAVRFPVKFEEFISQNILASMEEFGKRCRPLQVFIKFSKVVPLLFGIVVQLMLFVVICILVLMYKFGSFLCIGLALWRISKRDYSIMDGEDKANLIPALDIFYSLILAQGAFFSIWSIRNNRMYKARTAVKFRRDCNFPPEWGGVSALKYLTYTLKQCWRDPTSADGKNMIHYAIDMLGSESWEDNLRGSRVLDAFIRQGADARSLLLPSRPKIQKLIDTLGWRRGPECSRELRELAARIVAYLASDIHLAQFPGAIRCVSSLLKEDTIHTYWSSKQQGRLDPPANNKAAIIHRVQREEKRRQKKEMEEEAVDGRTGCNQLILQGLTILKKLATDEDNCRDICSEPGLLSKITAPLYSDTLIQDITIDDWAEVVNRSFKAVRQIIRAPGDTGREQRLAIRRKEPALSNLEDILNQDNNAPSKLQMLAMEILTELVLDQSIRLPESIKENLFLKQLQVFLAEDKEKDKGEQGDTSKLKATAGRMLVLLSTNSKINSDFIRKAYSDAHSSSSESPDESKGSIVYRLTQLLNNTQYNIKYRILVAEILENLCTHCDLSELDKQTLKQKLLPELLTEILHEESPESAISDEPKEKSQLAQNSKKSREKPSDQNQKSYAEKIDEENPPIPAAGNNSDTNDNISSQGNSSEISKKHAADQVREEQISRKELQEAILSLIFVMCDKVMSPDDFDYHFQENISDEDFVKKLKAIVQENSDIWPYALRCEMLEQYMHCLKKEDSDVTVESLRIIKLCGQISVSLMDPKHGHYTELFRRHEFVKSLDEASKVMSSLESCMIYAGTDFGLKRAVRPLLSDIVKCAQELAG